MENNVVNFNQNPKVKKIDSVLGVIYEDKEMVNGKDILRWREYSLVVEVAEGMCLRVLIKPDSKQLNIVNQLHAFDKVSDCPWSVI